MECIGKKANKKLAGVVWVAAAAVSCAKTRKAINQKSGKRNKMASL